MLICVGIDAAKTIQWIVGINKEARVILDRCVANEAGAIDELATELYGLRSDVMVRLGGVGSFARLLEAVLLADSFALAHAPGIVVIRAGRGFASG